MTARDPEGGNPTIVAPSGATYKITSTKFYRNVHTLSKENDMKFLEQLKSILKEL